MVELKAKG
jgi:coiled-coil domain-containing protein 40